MIKINNNFNEIINEEKTLVDFNADWCGPCRMMSPILEEIEKEKNIKIVSVNVDESESLARNYNVNSIPCLILFKNGKEIKRSIGLKPKEEIIKFIGEE